MNWAELTQAERDAAYNSAAAVPNVAELRERIAHDGRRRKMQDSTAERLRSFWSDQLSPPERAALAGLHPNRPVIVVWQWIQYTQDPQLERNILQPLDGK